jgi:O-acetyl-ADP-ribose deacetylase (regulator of RNase III)
MIYEVEGDILLTRAQLMVHNVTTFDPMNRGIARKLKDKYPAMAEAFHL